MGTSNVGAIVLSYACTSAVLEVHSNTMKFLRKALAQRIYPLLRTQFAEFLVLTQGHAARHSGVFGFREEKKVAAEMESKQRCS